MEPNNWGQSRVKTIGQGRFYSDPKHSSIETLRYLGSGICWVSALLYLLVDRHVLTYFT